MKVKVRTHENPDDLRLLIAVDLIFVSIMMVVVPTGMMVSVGICDVFDTVVMVIMGRFAVVYVTRTGR